MAADAEAEAEAEAGIRSIVLDGLKGLGRGWIWVPRRGPGRGEVVEWEMGRLAACGWHPGCSP